jgi:hypothetical protein
MIKELENWYFSNCNEDWEHQYGVKFETLDNPGWRVEIDLVGTKLEKMDFKEVNEIEPELEWIVCKVENKKFIGAGGPKELNNILKVFINWARLNNAI